MMWRAARPFTLNGKRYAVGDPIPDADLPADIRDKLKRYRRITDDIGEPSTLRDQASRAINKLGYGWYTVEGVAGKFHGKKAALTAAGVAA